MLILALLTSLGFGPPSYCDPNQPLTEGMLCAGAPASDIAPQDLVVHSANSYPHGTQAASDLLLGGGIDEKKVTVTNIAIAAADTCAVTVNGITTTLTEGTGWDCITSTTVCATNLAAAIDALDGVSAASSAAIVYLTPDQCGTYSVALALADGAADGVFGTASAGTDGKVIVVGALEVEGAVMFADGISLPDDQAASFGDSDDYWWVYNSGASRYELWTTDSDGAGTDLALLAIDDGTPIVDVIGTLGGLSVADDSVLLFGAGPGAPVLGDYYMYHDPLGSFNLWSSDTDGIGTGDYLLQVIDGDDVVLFPNNTLTYERSAWGDSFIDRYWVVYNGGGGGPLELWTNDSDGVGTDAVVWSVPIATKMLSMNGNVNMNSNDVVDGDDWWHNDVATDAVPTPVTAIATTPVFEGTNAANTTGANLWLAPSPGARNLSAFTRGNFNDGETLIIKTVTSAGAVATAITITEAADSVGNNVDCSGAASDIICVCLIYDDLLAGAAAGGYVVKRTDAACSDERLFLGILPGSSIEIQVVFSDTTWATLTVGTNGRVAVGQGGVRIEQSGAASTPDGVLGQGIWLRTTVNGFLDIMSYSGASYGRIYATGIQDSSADWQLLTANGLALANDVEIQVSSTSAFSGAKDVGLKRQSAGQWGLTNGAGTFTGTLNYVSLGSATIDMSLATAQTIYTVGAGRVHYANRVIARDASGAITLATGGFGYDALCTDHIAGQALTSVTATVPLRMAVGANSPEGPAAAVFCYKATVQEAEADTIVIDVIGELR